MGFPKPLVPPMAPHPANSFHFQLPPNSFEKLPMGALPSETKPYDLKLTSALHHALRVGLVLNELENPPPNSTLNKIRPTGDAELDRFVAGALVSTLGADKFFALRLTGRSMRYILSKIPRSSPVNKIGQIFQLCVWRAFAFGDLSRLEKLLLSQKAHFEFDKAGIDLAELTERIRGFSKAASGLVMPAYGQLQVLKPKFPEMLEKFLEVARELAADLEKGNNLTFKYVTLKIVKKNIPALPKAGILQWVIGCDFSEYEICSPPTPGDLAAHMTEGKGGPAGPDKALQIIKTMMNPPGVIPSSKDQLTKSLEVVMELLNKAGEAKQGETVPELRDLARQCEAVQGRKINICDIEHALCKISREVSAAKGPGNKRKREGDGEDGNGGRESRKSKERQPRKKK